MCTLFLAVKSDVDLAPAVDRYQSGLITSYTKLVSVSKENVLYNIKLLCVSTRISVHNVPEFLEQKAIIQQSYNVAFT